MAINTDTKRIYRDSIFRSYFREPENFVQLCNAVTGLSLTADQVTENTIDDIIFSNPRNDVSFNADGKSFIFFEHQSTRNANMPLRMLFYLTMIYFKEIPDDLIYHDVEIILPAPRFFVFYNGKRPCPEKFILKLTDNLRGFSDVEANVHVYNVNYNKDFELLRECRPIHDYSFFINQVDINKREGMKLEEAVIKAMKTCIELGIMKDFLNARKWEVFEVLNLAWNEEDAHKSYFEQGVAQGKAEGIAQGKAEGITQGIEQGTIKTKLEIIKNSLKEKMSPNLIAKITDLSVEQIIEIEKNLDTI